MQRISIVGFGRFGKVLYSLLKDQFDITLYDKVKIENDGTLAASTVIAKEIDEIYTNNVVFFAVPIDAFEKIISTHARCVKENHLLIDTLSVKVHPETILKKFLKNKGAQAILTHPMFGPDSSSGGFEGLPIVLDKFMASQEKYDFWKNVFASRKLKVIEMSARDHDKIAAHSQGLTHFIGRLLEAYGFEATGIDSLGTQKLLEVMQLTANDTWQLFVNLQHFNPYTKTMRLKLGEKYEKLYNELLPEKADPEVTTYGIQGGHGSFNEEAILFYLGQKKPETYKIKYLHTSANVMKALHEGEIDRGQMAIHNSVGGIVDESIQAMAKYKFKIVDQFQIKISHALMIRPDADISNIDTIMSHPQVFAQCKATLAEKYPRLTQTSGEGDLIDHAKVAQKLGEKELPINVATMGSRVLAELYGLKIVEENLQDAQENYTAFVQVKRI